MRDFCSSGGRFALKIIFCDNFSQDAPIKPFDESVSEADRFFLIGFEESAGDDRDGSEGQFKESKGSSVSPDTWEWKWKYIYIYLISSHKIEKKMYWKDDLKQTNLK